MYICDKDFLLFPINKSLHWSLDIVCYPNLLLKRAKEEANKRDQPEAQEFVQLCAEDLEAEFSTNLVHVHVM
jgi:hypothetical protein